MWKLSFLTALAVSAFTAAAADAATRYAEPGGDGPAGTCPRTDPCSIHAAVEGNIAPGTEVLLAGGNYLLGGNPLNITRAITLRPAPGEPRPQLIANGAAAIVYDDGNPDPARPVIIRALDVTSFDSGTDEFAIRPAFIGSVALLDRLYARSSGQQDFATVLASDGTVVRNSIVVNTASTPGNPTAIYTGGTGAVIRNTTAVAFEEAGRAIAADVDWASDPHRLRVINSIASGDSGDIVAEDTHVVENDIQVDVRHSAYDLAIDDPPETQINELDGNRSTFPLFADLGGFDFHQLSGSVTIDAGTGGDSGPRDFDGDPRSQGTSDIGADEANTKLLKLRRSRPRLRRSLRVRAGCPWAACEGSARARMRLPGGSLRLGRDEFALEGGETTRLRFRASRRELRRIRQNLDEAVLVVRGEATDDYGIRSRAKARLSLRD